MNKYAVLLITSRWPDELHRILRKRLRHSQRVFQPWCDGTLEKKEQELDCLEIQTPNHQNTRENPKVIRQKIMRQRSFSSNPHCFPMSIFTYIKITFFCRRTPRLCHLISSLSAFMKAQAVDLTAGIQLSWNIWSENSYFCQFEISAILTEANRLKWTMQFP